MVTVNKIGGTKTTKECVLFGLSTDEKPTDKIPNGSFFYCMDDMSIFMFDEENVIWIKQERQ